MTVKSEKTVHFFLSIFAPFLPFGFIITATLTHTHATDSSIVQCVCVNLTALHWLPMLAMDNSFSSVASASSSLRRCILSLPPPLPSTIFVLPLEALSRVFPLEDTSLLEIAPKCDGGHHHCRRTIGTGQRSVFCAVCTKNRSS